MKRKLSKWVGILLIIAPIVALGFSLRDLFLPVTGVKIIPMPEMKFVYTTHVGSYRKAPEWFAEFSDLAPKSGVVCKDYAIEYLDILGAVEEANLRSRVGCLVDSFPDKLAGEFQTKTFPPHIYITAHRRTFGELVSFTQAIAMDAYCLKYGYREFGYRIELYNPKRDGIGPGTVLIRVEKLSYNDD